MFEKVKQWFRRVSGKEISLNRVRDSITIREGNETLTLRVDSDAKVIISRLNKAQKELKSMDEQTTDEERRKAAHELAEAMFGAKQSEELFDFYNQDTSCVVAICGLYFGDPKHGLGKKITKAQIKRK